MKTETLAAAATLNNPVVAGTNLKVNDYVITVSADNSEPLSLVATNPIVVVPSTVFGGTDEVTITINPLTPKDGVNPTLPVTIPGYETFGAAVTVKVKSGSLTSQSSKSYGQDIHVNFN